MWKRLTIPHRKYIPQQIRNNPATIIAIFANVNLTCLLIVNPLSRFATIHTDRSCSYTAITIEKIAQIG